MVTFRAETSYKNETALGNHIGITLGNHHGDIPPYNIEVHGEKIRAIHATFHKRLVSRAKKPLSNFEKSYCLTMF